MSTQQSYQRNIAIAIVAIIALLGLNGYLWYNKVNQDKLIEQHSSELIETERLQAELEKSYYEALSELEEMRTANTELNSLIDGQKADLKAQKDRVAMLLVAQRDLDSAKAELVKLRKMSVEYAEEVQRLKEENTALAQSNQILQQEKEILTDEVQREREANQELQNAAGALVSENEALAQEREMLAKRVTKAEVVNVSEVDVTGYRLRNSGKEAKTQKARNIEGLKICFNTLENKVVSSGNEQFYVRIINPLGETLAVDELGSGVMTKADNEESLRYTQYRQVDYTNAEAYVCMNWQPGTSFNPGEYMVEVYNKGHLAGNGTFALK